MATRTENGSCAWSHSRANTMATCQRQFYFSYCAPARWDHPDPKMRDLFLLKQVKPIAMWKGDVVHQAIADFFRALQSGRTLPDTAVLQYAEQLAKTQWSFSVTGRYRTQGRSRAGLAFAALFEHEYGVEDAESLDQALEHIQQCLLNFFQIDKTERISDSFRSGRNHLVEPPAWGPGATKFEIPGVSVTVKVDLAFHTQNDEYHIFDWKTGKPADDSVPQLELYSLWAHQSLGLELDSITAHEVSLSSLTSSSHQLTEPGKFYRLEAIRRSAGLIDALTLSSSSTEPQLRDFNYARYLWTCRRCPLQRVCQELP
jgi:hypothetical protein